MQDFRMETFLAVCRTMNYTRAAEELNLTQPAVSQHIRYLERFYGARLFAYGGKKLSLTEQGKLLRSAALSIAHDQRSLRDKMAAAGARRLNFGVTLTAGEYLAVPPVARYLKENPRAGLRMVVADTDALLEHLDRGEIDFALVEGFFDKQEYDCLVYRTERFFPVCGATYQFEDEPCTLEALLSQRLLLREPGSGTRAVLEHALAARNLTVYDFPLRTEIASINIIKALAEENCGIAFLYEAAVAAELKKGTLRRIALDDWNVSHEMTFLWRTGSLFAQEYQAVFHDWRQSQPTV